MREYYVYVMTNNSGTLYTGMTNDIERRVREHKLGLGNFTRRYKVTRLVYCESAGNDVLAAIAWEKQIKGWVRRRKIALIASFNPT